jgi:hypothetical protein
MKLVRPGLEHLSGYVAALERGWSADNERGIEAAREERRLQLSLSRAREGPPNLNFNFSVVIYLRAIVVMRQEIAKLCGFPAIQTRFAFVDNLYRAECDERRGDGVRRLMCRAANFCGIAIAQEVNPVRT